jgi:O-antigen/teichoic acid export membrane protein
VRASRQQWSPHDPVFPPSEVVGDLARQSVRGGAATMGGQVAKFVLSTGSNIALARLLSPRDFGLVAMAVVVTMFGGLIKDLGLSLATIQREKITHQQVSTLFWINVVVSVALGVVVIAASGLIAGFYDEPEVRGITIALSSTFIFGGLTAQHNALLQRQMRFSRMAAIEVIAMVLGTAVAISAALSGAGYWSIVLWGVVSTFVTMALSWLSSRWRPGRPGSLASVRSMLVEGANFTGFNILSYLGREADNLLIGWRWGADPLGLYTRAYALLMLPLNQINSPMTGVALPVLSRLQDDDEEYRRYYLRALNLVNHLSLPFLALLMALSEPAIVAVLGSQWRGAAPIFSVLAIAALGQPSLFTMAWVTLSRGQAEKQWRWALASVPVVILSFVIGLPWGPIGVAWAYAIAMCALTAPGLAYAFKGTPIALRDAWGAVRRPASNSAMLLATAFVSTRLMPAEATAWASLSVGLAAAAVTLAGSLLLWRGLREEFAVNLSLLRHLRGSD